MPSDLYSYPASEVGHILFVDVVGYSKLAFHEQHEAMHKLSQVVRNTDAFTTAEADEKLLQLSTGTGFVLAFAAAPDVPVRCALQLAKGLRSYPELKVRMGIHSGPVSRIIGVNDRLNVVGTGLNIARRITDCGDAGHILVSKRVAEHLGDDWHLQPHLHELGECETTNGEIISVVNLFTDEVGNRVAPKKFKRLVGTRPSPHSEIKLSPIPAQNTLLAILLFSVAAIAIGYWIFFPPAQLDSANNSTGPEVQVLTSATKGMNRWSPENHPTPSQHLAAHH